jgi:sec-independent protein translocase protein TatB
VLDIGWTELLVIIVVAVVVVGPKDLPRMMRVAGQWMGRARAMADQFRRSFDDMARQSELEELRAEVMKLHNDKTLAEIHRETDVMLGYIPPDPLQPVEGRIENIESDPNIHGVDPELIADTAAPLPQPDVPAQAEPAVIEKPQPAESPLHRDEP